MLFWIVSHNFARSLFHQERGLANHNVRLCFAAFASFFLRLTFFLGQLVAFPGLSDSNISFLFRLSSHSEEP